MPPENEAAETTTNEAPATETNSQVSQAEEQRQKLIDIANAELKKFEENEEGSDGSSEPEAPPAKPEAKTEVKKDPEEDEEAGLSKLQRELRQREKRHGKLAEFEERETQLESAMAKVRQITADAEHKQKLLNAELEKYTRLQSLPIDQKLRELGWSTDDFIEHSIKEKDPQYQAERKYEDRFTKIEQTIAEKDAEIKRLDAIAKSYADQEKQQTAEASSKQFLDDLKDSPARVMWDDGYILQMAWDSKKAYEAKYRKTCPIELLSEHVHVEALKRAKQLGVSIPQESAGKTAIKSKANGSRAITQQDASQRRAPVGKSFKELEPEEQRKHLISLAEEEFRKVRPD